MSELTREDIRWLLDKLIEDHLFYRNHRIVIKRWCVTVWLAVLVGVSSGHLLLGVFGSLLLLLLPVLLFWFLESIYGAITIIVEQHIVAVERRFTESASEGEEVSNWLFVTGRERFSLSQKFRALLSAMFVRETVWALYVLLLPLSAGVVGLLSLSGLIPGTANPSP